MKAPSIAAVGSVAYKEFLHIYRDRRGLGGYRGAGDRSLRCVAHLGRGRYRWNDRPDPWPGQHGRDAIWADDYQRDHQRRGG